jgi:hypothetical protein
MTTKVNLSIAGDGAASIPEIVCSLEYDASLPGIVLKGQNPGGPVYFILALTDQGQLYTYEGCTYLRGLDTDADGCVLPEE